MIKVDNASFLKFLENESIIRNYYTCDNIVNAGKPGYGVKSISVYTADGKPSDSYVSFSENLFDELIAEFKTDDPALIDEALREAKKTANKYKAVRLGSRETSFFGSAVFKKYFRVKKMYADKYGVFARLSENDLPAVSVPDNIRISLVPKEDKSQYAAYDDEAWDGLPSMIRYGNDTDKLYILKENGEVCGYLLANSSSYKNVYDIANLFVSEKYRGQNYGQLLTVTFVNDCYQNGLIPHYGNAASAYSAAVALKSGFTEMYRQHFADVKAKPF